MSVTEDDIVRRKLLVDGDGGGDDKRLVTILKMVIEFCNDQDDTPQECEAKYQRMMAQLSNAEYQAEKTSLVREMLVREQDRYDKLYSEISDRIASAQTEIEECKEELIKAKEIRRNKQEYDAWAKKVMELPDREKTTQDLKKEQEKLAEMRQTQAELEQKLEYRKKQFAVLLTSVMDLQHQLSDEGMMDKTEEMEIVG